MLTQLAESAAFGSQSHKFGLALRIAGLNNFKTKISLGKLKNLEEESSDVIWKNLGSCKISPPRWRCAENSLDLQSAIRS